MNTNQTPQVSVIMPMYNGARYIREAVESILRQTLTDLELIIIDDGSTDDSLAIVQSFNDPRIRIVKNEKNSGLSAVRSQGLSLASGEFIAFLDCDDIAYKNRLQLEVDFLTTHPSFGIVGSYARLIDSDGKPTGISWQEYIAPEKFPIRAMFGNTFTTSSVMLRKSALPQEYFREGFAPAEDYEFWVRVLKNSEGWNIPEILTDYRTHATGTSVTKKELQQKAIDRIIASQLQEIGVTPSAEELALHRKNYGFAGTPDETKKFLKLRETWLQKLAVANQQTKKFPDALFEEVMAEKWLDSCSSNARLGLTALKIFRRSPLGQKISIKNNLQPISKFIVKCFLGKDSF